MLGLATVLQLHTARDAHMKCEDNLSFMRPLPDGMMHLIVTSPPYNIGKRYERRSPLDAYIQAQAQVISECVRLLHEEGSLCWQVGGRGGGGGGGPRDMH